MEPIVSCQWHPSARLGAIGSDAGLKYALCERSVRSRRSMRHTANSYSERPRKLLEHGYVDLTLNPKP